MAIQPDSKMNTTELMTQKEIAEALGICRVAVYQIEVRAFEKIKRALKRRKINIEDLLP